MLTSAVAQGLTRTPPPTPLDIFGADLAMWFPPYLATGRTMVGNAFSVRTNLGSETGRLPQIEQPVAARRPTDYTFRGASAYWLATAAQQRMVAPAAYAVLPQPFFISMPIKQPQVPDTGSQVVWTGGASTCSAQILNARTLRIAAPTNRDLVNVLPNRPTAFLWGLLFNGANSRQYIDNVPQAIVNPGTNGPTNFILGASATLLNHATLSVGDFVCVKRVPTSGELDALWAYYQYWNRLGEAEAQLSEWGASQYLGTGSTDTLGQRWRCFERWGYHQIGGKWLQQVGPFGDFSWPGDRHRCQAGAVIADLIAAVPNLLGAGNLYHPDVLAWQIGGNDLVAGRSAADVLADYVTLAQDIATAEPSIKQVLRTVSNMGPAVGAPVLAELALLQAGTPGTLASIQGLGIDIVGEDNASHVGPYDVALWNDSIHYNDAGHTKSVNKATDNEGLYEVLESVVGSI